MQSQTFTWVGGEHEFALRIGHLRAVQQHCDAGPQEILDRIMSRKWRVDDLFEVIRQGLIGGGMKSDAASKLVSDMMERHPLIEFTITAQAILATALVGPGDDMPGEAEGVEAAAPENGASQTSTGSAQ